MYTGNLIAARGRVKCGMEMRVLVPKTFRGAKLSTAKNRVFVRMDNFLNLVECAD
jgi:hypothetical protein